MGLRLKFSSVLGEAALLQTPVLEQLAAGSFAGRTDFGSQLSYRPSADSGLQCGFPHLGKECAATVGL